MHVERVTGDYIEPDIIDLEDGTGCLFRIHATDISEDGTIMLSELLTQQAQLWAPRPPGSPLGPVIHVTWHCVAGTANPVVIEVEEGPGFITYTVDASVLTQHAGDFLGRLDTQRSPYWQRVPKGYHDGDDAGS
ncbi:hypothetical protein [Streptomyces sp. MUM 16J]|uniref:hypothetical protein n=1 Tax=Streptomyces sp. MUM 16J TaxID=2791988 RepID=UPI001F04C84F|nr:hypothetical protein [Streptomyces sp. MUM 16J]MCH0555781.1 hypothetical protein [Streptomyces sp. MUM 16J]